MQAPTGLHSHGPISDSPMLTQPPPLPHQRQFAGMQQPHSDEGSSQQPFSSQGRMQQPFPSQRSTQQPYSSEGSAQLLPPGLPFVKGQQLSMHSGASQHGSGELTRQHSEVQIFPARQPRQHQSLNHNVGLQSAESNGWDHDLSSFNPNAGSSAMHEGFASQHAQQPEQQPAQPQFERSSNGVSAQRAQHLARPSFGCSSSGSSAQHVQHTTVTGLFQQMNVGSQMSHPQPSSSSQHGCSDDYPSHLECDEQSRHSSQYGAGSSSFTLTNRPQLGLPSQPKRRPYEPHKQPPSPLQAGDRSFGFGHPRDHMQPAQHVQPSQKDGWDASTHQSGYHQSQADIYPHNGFGHQSSSRDQVGSPSAFGTAPLDDEYGRASYRSSQDGHDLSLSQRHRSTGSAAGSSSGKVLTVPRPSFTEARSSHQSVEADSPIEPPPGLPADLDYSTGVSTHMHCLHVFECSAGSHE